MAGRRRERDRAGRRSARLTGGQKGLIAVAAVLAVALMGVAAWKSLFVRPELPDKGTGPDGSAQEIDWGEGVRPPGGGARKRKANRTVLIRGRDTGGGGNTDTMLLASYDVTNQKATVMSIPRDTMVNIPYDVKKINGVYNYGGGGEAGIQYLYKEISQLVGFEPDYQVVVEWEAVGQIVDAMDGVWFDVPRNMNYDDPLQNLHIHQEKGYRLLSGEDAMEVLRYRRDNDKRYGYPEGDVGRIKTQQAFLSAMVEQLLKVENVPKIRQFIQVFQDNVETDLTFQNILWFAQSAYLGGLRTEDVEFVTMPHRNVDAWSRSYSQDLEYVVPVADELLDLVNTKLSPYTEVFTLGDLDIMSVASDGSVRSTSGHVEDAKAARPPARPSAPPSTSAEAPAEETPPEESGPPAEQEPAGEAGASGSAEATVPEEGGGSPEAAPPAGGGTAEPDPPPAAGETPDDGEPAAEAPDDGFIIVS